MNQQSEHLSNAQIEQYGKRASDAEPETEVWVDQHLDDCSSCRSRVLDFQRTRFALLPNPKVNKASTSGCPSEDDLRNLAAGLYTDPKASQLKAHAASCDHCGPLLQQYKEDFSDESSPDEQAFLDKLRTSSPEFREQKAREMFELNLSKKNPVIQEPVPATDWRRVFSWKWVPAFSFVLLLAAGASWVYPFLVLHNRRVDVEAEYRKGRPMKYRPADVPYGRHKSELGSEEDAPIIEIPNRERDPVLASNADLLHHDTGDAKSILESALGNTRPLPVLNNLAVAYAWEAEQARPVSDQDKEAQKKVYQKALNLTGEILDRSPSDHAALFNRALILEDLGNTKDAIKALEKLCQVEQDAEWRKEATDELRRMQPTR